MHTAWIRCQQIYWQGQIAGDVQAPGRIAFERTAAIRSADLVDGFAGPVTMFHGDCGGPPSTAWQHLAAVMPPASRRSVAPPLVQGLPGPTLFVGRLRSAGGYRFVRVQLEFEADGSAGEVQLVFDVTDVIPATITLPPLASQSDEPLSSNDALGQAPEPGPNWTPADTDIASIDRGVIVPNEPSKFTCDYTAKSGRQHRIEGTLSADGTTMAFAFRAAPDTPADRQPIATPALGR